jgi:hypothetical protein
MATAKAKVLFGSLAVANHIGPQSQGCLGTNFLASCSRSPDSKAAQFAAATYQRQILETKKLQKNVSMMTGWHVEESKVPGFPAE